MVSAKIFSKYRDVPAMVLTDLAHELGEGIDGRGNGGVGVLLLVLLQRFKEADEPEQAHEDTVLLASIEQEQYGQRRQLRGQEDETE